jgi:hypothetical protein
MEGAPKAQNIIGPEDFFANKIQVLPVSKNEFLDLVKLKYPEKTNEEILQIKGINFDHDGEVIVLLRTDVFPEKYMPYLETHEKWEAYIARKKGYNLLNKSIREYKTDKQISCFDEKSEKEFFNEIGKYNYEFRHEYAIYKEYEQAMKDSKLDEYHKWFIDLREKEKVTANNKNIELIENDIKIRDSIFKKIKEGNKHLFSRIHL